MLLVGIHGDNGQAVPDEEQEVVLRNANEDSALLNHYQRSGAGELADACP